MNELLKEEKVLNLGSGQKKLSGAINVDITPETNPEVVHDLNIRPWPFADGSFTKVYASDVVEHLDNIVGMMNELHRICRSGARIEITVPHYSSANAFTDPTHRHYFGCFSFDYFTGKHEQSHYTRNRFRLLNRLLMFQKSPTSWLVRRLAKRFPAKYEQSWAWIFPAWYLWFELEVVKD